MAKQLQLRRGTTAQHSTFTGAVGEVTIDTDKDVVVVHDGATAGGFPSQKQLVSGTNIKTVNSTTLLGSGNVAVQPTLVSGTNIKTINSNSLLGSGNVSIGVSGLSDTSISSPLSGQVLSYNGVNWANVTFSALPSQSGQSGKFLTTDGSTATWETIDALPSQTGNAGKFLTTNGTTASWGGSVVNGTSSRNTYTATAGQTTFSSTYDVGYVDVYRNGLKLSTSDFTATNGTTVVLNNACSLNDVVDIVAYGTFELAAAYTKNDTDVLLAAKAPLASPALTGTPTVNGVAFSGYSGFKNRIINGDFRVNQYNRLPYIAQSVNSAYIDGNFRCANSGTGTLTISDDTITYQGTTYSAIKVTATTAITLGTDTRYFGLGINLEANNISSISNKDMTLSFLFECSRAGKYSVALVKVDSSTGVGQKTFITTFTAVAGVQQVTIPIPADSYQVLKNNTSGIIIQIGFVTNNASVISSTNGWVSGSAYMKSDALAWGNTAGAYIKVTNVQLEEGSVATPFDDRPYGLELSLCQRYYQKLTGSNVIIAGGAYRQGGYYFTVPLANPLRVFPTFGGTPQISSDGATYVNATLDVSGYSGTFVLLNYTGGTLDQDNLLSLSNCSFNAEL